MSETPAIPTLAEDKEARLPLIIYVLYLASFVVGFTSIIGIVVAYVNKGEGPDWIQSHYQFQIRTFWLGLLLGIGALILMLPLAFFGIGFLLPLAVAVWFIVRCVFGIKYLSHRQPHPDPTTWKW